MVSAFFQHLLATYQPTSLRPHQCQRHNCGCPSEDKKSFTHSSHLYSDSIGIIGVYRHLTSVKNTYIKAHRAAASIALSPSEFYRIAERYNLLIFSIVSLKRKPPFFHGRRALSIIGFPIMYYLEEFRHLHTFPISCRSFWQLQAGCSNRASSGKVQKYRR